MTVSGRPQALLVEHPALPQPLVDRWPPGTVRPVAELGVDERYRIAVQLVALSALLMEFELWPGRSVLRRAAAEIGDFGPRAVLPRSPVPLSRVWTRLGGGEAAADALKLGVLETVAEVTGVERERLFRGGSEPGFFLDQTVAMLLDDVERPLDRATARSLWMLRWSMPPAPDPGDALLCEVDQLHVARRIAAAMWVAARRRKTVASIEVTEDGRLRTVAGRPGGERDLSIIVGSIGEDELARRLDRRGGRSETVVVIGRLPAGWSGVQPPIFEPARLSSHLAIVGISPARRAGWLEQLATRFDPFDRADLRSLTRSAVGRFSEPAERAAGGTNETEAVVALNPEGLTRDRLLELTGGDCDELAASLDRRTVIERRELLFPSRAVSLRVDPRHADIAELFGSDDPRRMLHLALATGDTGRLLAWARERLDDLDTGPVRRLLAAVDPGALGPGVQLALTEACLGLADLHGARRALAAVEPALAEPWRRWIELLDRSPGFDVATPSARECRFAPRPCAEIGLVQLRRGMWHRGQAAAGPLEAVERSLEGLGGAALGSARIRLAARLDPARLDDRGWRRAMTQGHPELLGLILFERSMRAIDEGDHGLAARLLRRLLRVEGAPGRLAFLHLNLGALAGESGAPRRAEILTLGAYRLFQAAGFANRSREAVHNLAVGDLDELRVHRARRRLDELAASGDTVFVPVERTRLALAVGDLEDVHQGLATLPAIDEVVAPRLVEALSLVHGIEALLEGAVGRARSLLDGGGREARPWLALCAAIADQPPSVSVAEDGWGVGRAAELYGTLRSGATPRVAVGDPAVEPQESLRVALCAHLGARPGWPDAGLRSAASQVLEQHGLTGWASRLRWDGDRADRLFEGLGRVLRAADAGDGEVDLEVAALLPALGVEGLVLRMATGGGEILRVGCGKECSVVRRGPLELVALGSRPVAPRAWWLLFDLLEREHRIPVDAGMTRSESTVRIDGSSAAADRLRSEVDRAAASGLGVLVEGETGTGKDVVARELHRLSERPGEFTAVNIAAVPANLLEAELFGSVRGAFTGADRSRRGLVRTANGGTLLLDEVGDLDGALQVKLLRFLESGEVRPVGADRSEAVDVRVVCATHRNLERRVREGAFREDLFYRIAVVRIAVPPLRERIEDIGALREVFERSAARRLGITPPRWSSAALQRLARHRWPGNVRELRHAVEVAILRAGEGPVKPEHLPFAARPAAIRGTWETVLDEHKRRLLADVLGRHRGNRSAAARELGISRQALLYQLKRLDLRDL